MLNISPQIGDFLYSFTPTLNSWSNFCASETKSRISALAFSDSGNHIAVAYHSDSIETGELGIWSIANKCFVAILSPCGIISSIDWCFSSTLLILWQTKNTEDSKSFAFVDWSSLKILTSEHPCSLKVKENAIDLFQTASSEIEDE
jgi:hypothetical protein